MKKWYDEEYKFEIETIGFLRGDKTENYCRNGEQIGDKYECTYGCPVNAQGYGICSKTMTMLYPIMEAVRSGGNLRKVGGEDKYVKTIVCPDGCVMFRLTATPLGNENFFEGKFYEGKSENQSCTATHTTSARFENVANDIDALLDTKRTSFESYSTQFGKIKRLN